jgi:hypothetical protein
MIVTGLVDDGCHIVLKAVYQAMSVNSCEAAFMLGGAGEE